MLSGLLSQKAANVPRTSGKEFQKAGKLLLWTTYKQKKKENKMKILAAANGSPQHLSRCNCFMKILRCFISMLSHSQPWESPLHNRQGDNKTLSASRGANSSEKAPQ